MANESKEALKLMQDNGCDVLDIKFIDLPGVWQHVSVPISEVNDGLFAMVLDLMDQVLEDFNQLTNQTCF